MNINGGPISASALMEKIRSGSVKIQTISSNGTPNGPIYAIPVSTNSGSLGHPVGHTSSSSPMKVIKVSSSSSGGASSHLLSSGVHLSSSSSSSSSGGVPQHQQTVKLVKIGNTSTLLPNAASVSSASSSSSGGLGLAARSSLSLQTTKNQQSSVVYSPSTPSKIQFISTSSSSVNPHNLSQQPTILLNNPNAQLTVHQQQIQRQQIQTQPISRKRADIDFDIISDSKRRKSDKSGKGLRHFSMKVCEKVQAKGSTSYNEVADELVSELTDPLCSSPSEQQYDHKNIRRRVYDALNVLMAMNIISKEKKEIRWLGLPTNSIQEAKTLELDKAKKIERIKAKTHQLQDLILQQIAFKNLLERNKERERTKGVPAPNSAIQLPFIIVNTSKKTVIDCSISNDKMEYLFNFDDTFEIHDDVEVLKRMGLSFGLENGQVSEEDLFKARSMVPKALEQYVIQLAENGPGSVVGMPSVSEPVELSLLGVGGGTSEGGGRVSQQQDSDIENHSELETDSDVDVN
eukprot:TRINITY_DN1453_c0_g1_i1.p1 TRINITY_DN1453_c0_g1~~TRINITY_DN1453_c0_g1_i1.p1  ORF type:complete len:517 (-),score=220.74 TRINITY_DN1453_c0_g1_i1:2184-3734(-)